MGTEGIKRGAVVITGASSGLGRATALHLDRLGFKVFAGFRSSADADRLRLEGSERLVPVELDITSTSTIQAAAECVSGALGEEDLVGLINNAGIVVSGPLEFVPLDELRKQFEVNVIGPVAVTQRFLPLLRRPGGRMIYIGSVSGRLALRFQGPYAASKFALEAIADSLRREVSQLGISVSILEPGPIATQIAVKAARQREAAIERLAIDVRARYPGFKPIPLESATAKGMPPDAVARVVARVLGAHRPRPRYVIGRNARMLTLLATLLPDRMLDALIERFH